MTSFFDAMQSLATAVAEKAAETNTPLAESTDALKALTPYFAILYKANKADVDMGLTFGDLKAEIEAVAEKQDGATKAVPGGGRRRPAWDGVAPINGGTILSGSSDADAKPQGVVSARSGGAG